MSRESRPATGHWVGYLSDDGHAQWTRELRRTLTYRDGRAIWAGAPR